MTSGIRNTNRAQETFATVDLPPQSPSKAEQQNLPFRQTNMKRRRLARLVSQDELAMSATCGENSTESSERSESPVHCVSEFDKAMSDSDSTKVPSHSNLLNNPRFLETHVAALRLEADLYPMRLLVARLMAHPSHNRKGLFNQPVDPVALGLPDYHLIISRPMDLGSVKRRLHAVAYESRDQVANDICLVFTNAAKYNPPHNMVHQCAKVLLAYFEEAYRGLPPCVASPPLALSKSTAEFVAAPMKSLPRSVSSVEEERSEDATAASTTSESIATPFLDNPTMLASESDTGASHAAAPGHASPPQMSSDSSSLNQAVGLSMATLPTHTAAVCTTHVPKRKSRLPPFLPHTCQSCQGRTCAMCEQGCLFHEPVLQVCQGVHCEGAKIRKGSVYYATSDGQRHFCQRCYPNLTPVLPNSSDNDVCRYKQDLLKRKNDEEIAEDWVTCSKCASGVHAICAMHNGYVNSTSDFLCAECQTTCKASGLKSIPEDAMDTEDEFTFLSGSGSPVPVSSLGSNNSGLDARSLPECSISSFIQAKVQERMHLVPNAGKTITVRVISDCSRHFTVPDVVRRHFRMATESDTLIKPPPQVRYRQKAITMFQKIDGLDVCIFCMYVQEYHGHDKYEDNTIDEINSHHKKRVYIAYIDSVEYFRPRQCRTEVYHEILVSYLATARARGYDTAQIWACPPSRGNSFVFWNHPSSQRTPSRERLVSWYHGALSRAINCGVVADVKSLFESEFENSMSVLDEETSESSKSGQSKIPTGRMICPPLLEGDCWIEEAVRVHQTSISRNLKVRAPADVCVWNVSPLSHADLDPCPALQVATLIKDRIMSHPCSVPFRRPVNAASLKLKNYHQIVTNPMDLGTIYSLCTIGEYHVLREMVDHVKLMVANAKKFNPVGNFVHAKADEVLQLFFQELLALTKIWDENSNKESQSWECYADMSMSLDISLDMPTTSTDAKPTSVMIEDDRSSDGSRSMASSVSVPASPMSGVTSIKDEESVQTQVTSTKDEESVQTQVTSTKDEESVQTQVTSAKDEESVQTQITSTNDDESVQTQVTSTKDEESVQTEVTSTKDEESVQNQITSTKDKESVQTKTAPASMQALPAVPVTTPRGRGRGRRRSIKVKKTPPRKLDLLSDGPEAVMQSMVGDDLWLMDKGFVAPKAKGPPKKTNGKRRRSLSSADGSAEDPAPNKRRQSWLGEEVSENIRKMRTTLFTCSLLTKANMSGAEHKKLETFQSYINSFDSSVSSHLALSSPITDARHALLEFSQFRHFEFDTLRRAKYSTAMLLYHLRHANAPGVVPFCTTCKEDIKELRWHKVKKVTEKRRVTKNVATAKQTKPLEPDFVPEELCGCCHAQHSEKAEFIPIPVSLSMSKPDELK